MSTRFTTAPTHGFRLTETPSLYGLKTMEHGEEIEYVSYAEGRRRMARIDSLSASVVPRLRHQHSHARS